VVVPKQTYPQTFAVCFVCHFCVCHESNGLSTGKLDVRAGRTAHGRDEHGVLQVSTACKGKTYGKEILDAEGPQADICLIAPGISQLQTGAIHT